jgi:hypothetical protein
MGEVAGGHDGGTLEGPGQPRRNLGGRHVDMDDVRATMTGESERPARWTVGRQVSDRRVEFCGHAVGRSSDGHD